MQQKRMHVRLKPNVIIAVRRHLEMHSTGTIDRIMIERITNVVLMNMAADQLISLVDAHDRAKRVRDEAAK